jgi:hypothetical protein
MKLLPIILLAAAPLCAQQSIVGTIVEFRTKTVEFAVKSDSGATTLFKVSPETQVVRVPPGEHDLTKAIPSAVTDLAIGDRVIVNFVEGMAEARRIVRMTPDDIERRNQAERRDWQQRGISGIVAAKTGGDITLEMHSMTSVETIHVAVTGKTAIRRYAPDSVKFTDALPSRQDEIAVGDQLRARGNKSEDGARVTAEDIVFGTFLTILGPITAVDREAGEVRIRDLKANAPLTIRVNADSRVKKMPDMREMFARMMKGSSDNNPPHQGSMAQMLEDLPLATLDDLKVGSTLVVTATRGSRADTVTAITLVANIDGLIQMAQSMPDGKGLSPMEAISRMHHGAMDGPNGFTLPALIP